MRILAIDDDQDSLTALRAVVRDALPGCELLTAANGPQGIELARSADPDLILLDILMPGMDGLDVCRQLKADERLQGIPVLFLTAFSTDRGSRVKVPETGADGFLSKPFETQALATHVWAMTKLGAASRLHRLEKEQLAALVAERTRELERQLSERKQAEAGLQESETRFRKLLQDVPAVAVQGYGPDGTTQYWNQASEQLYGYSAQEACGRNLVDLIIPPEMREGVEQAIRQMAETGQAIPAAEMSLMRKDGSRVAVFSSHTIVQVPGRPQELFCVDIDLTERKLAEAALRESEERYRAVADFTYAWEYWTAPDGSLIYVSPSCERITGYRAEEFRQDPDLLARITHPDDRDRLVDLTHGHGPSTAHPERHEQDFRILARDGGERWIGHACQRVYGRTGEYLGRRASNRDITEARQAAAETETLRSQFVQAQKMESVGRLAGGVAHDFNNLLMGIMGYAELCRDALAADHPIREWLEEITRDAQRSADITRQLLAFARKQAIAPKILDLNDALMGMLKMLRRLIGEDIDLAWMPGAKLWPVKLDPSQIDQTLANLCVNARDAIGGAGKLSISTANVTLAAADCAHHAGAVPGDYVRLAVSDDGCGMSADVKAHLFEPFFTTKEVGKGTGLGLGLATVYGIVTQNHGFINVDSTVGKGTTFAVYFPRFVGNAAEASAPAAANVPRGRGETVLLVEDEKSLRVTLALFLNALGYKALVAENPAAALALATQHPGAIQLLLTDVVMPGQDGRHLADQLAGLKPGLKVLFMSGYTADVVAQHGILDPVVRFIGKPFSRDELARKVHEVLDSGNAAAR